METSRLTTAGAPGGPDPAGPADPADALYSALRQAVRLPGLTPATVMAALVSAMVAAEQLGSLSGAEKKAAVLAALGRLAAELPAGPDRDAVQLVLAAAGPAAIDALIAASRGALALNARLGARCDAACGACCGDNGCGACCSRCALM